MDIKVGAILTTPEPAMRVVRYQLTPKNVGKTAARNVSIRVLNPTTTDTDNAEISKALNKMERDLLLTGKAPPFADGRPSPEIVRSHAPVSLAPNTNSNSPILEAAVVPFQNGKMVQRGELIGRIDYLDVFGTQHWNEFCFIVIDQDGTLQACQDGNDEDQNPES